MANVTITANEEILQRARIEAARRNISLSRFLGDVLAEKFAGDDAYERAMREFLASPPWPLPDEPPRADGRRWMRRDELYDRQGSE
ncbi:MAG: hypothetical protein HY778_00895 [Betaproteobacteria bacterium]|nr:hypothetical protein [Betaproteobacteria bacterium]